MFGFNTKAKKQRELIRKHDLIKLEGLLGELRDYCASTIYGPHQFDRTLNEVKGLMLKHDIKKANFDNDYYLWIDGTGLLCEGLKQPLNRWR